MIGQEIARLSIGDDNILALLHRLKQPTFFTRDEHFFNRRLCHPNYALVWVDAAAEEAAMFIGRVLRHPRFMTKASRMGIVVRAHHDGLQFWKWPKDALQRVNWSKGKA